MIFRPPAQEQGGIGLTVQMSKKAASNDAASMYYQFQIRDDLKAARIEAARRTEEYVEQPKTNQRRKGLYLELE